MFFFRVETHNEIKKEFQGSMNITLGQNINLYLVSIYHFYFVFIYPLLAMYFIHVFI